MNCDIQCPNNCRYKTCHIKNGTCFGCVAGYMGTFCKTGMFFPFPYLEKQQWILLLLFRYLIVRQCICRKRF